MQRTVNVVQRMPVVISGEPRSRINVQDLPDFGLYLTRLDDVVTLVQRTFAEGDDTVSLEQQLREVVDSNDELRERARNLLSQIPDLEQRDSSRIRRWRMHLPATLKRGSNTESQNSIIDADTTRMLNTAFHSFLLRDLDQLYESFVTVIDTYNAAVERRNQFQVAEELANFIAQVISEPRSYRSLDSSRYDVAPRNTISHEDNFADINLWLAGDTPVYLLTGDIGSGKTYIAYQLCGRLHSSPHPSLKLVTSFFFDAEDTNSIDLLLSSLAYQIRPDLRSETLDTVRRFRTAPSAMPSSPFRQMLRDALASTLPPERTRTVIIIDGVDQCRGRGNITDLLQYLLTLVSDFPWLHLFLTLRPRPYIMAVLAQHNFSHRIHQRHLIEDIQQDYAGDVQRFLKDKVQRLPSYGAYLRQYPRALPQLAKLADGDPTFARVAANFLAHEDAGIDPGASFELLFSDRSHTRLVSLDALYWQIMRRAMRGRKPWEGQYQLLILRSVSVERTTSMTVDSILTYINAHPSHAPEYAYLGSSISLDQIVTAVDDMRSVLKIDLNFEVHSHDDTFPDFLGNQPVESRLITSRPHTLASICLATVTQAKPLTAALEPCSCLLASPAHRWCQALTRHALSLWPRYISEVAALDDPLDRMLSHQLGLFVPSPQLAMYAWVRTPQQVMCAGKALMRYFRPNGLRCSEYFKFVSFVHLSRSRRSEPRLVTDLAADLMQAVWDTCTEGGDVDLVVTRPNEATISLQLINNGVHAKTLLKLSFSVNDVMQYDDIMRDFQKQLQDASQETLNYAGLISGTYRIDDEGRRDY
ncbi:AAA-16 domain-containing protein [Phanerochaete sordida]|uniref:AAA-16 domain-containing protein n=1 Tax=Phanerochaete sordida TaxID=48140 RepID=A0A9P3LIK7_9APHY|nr:AAA-16 domain-containing protein [Phanerochaete sordida]